MNVALERMSAYQQQLTLSRLRARETVEDGIENGAALSKLRAHVSEYNALEKAANFEKPAISKYLRNSKNLRMPTIFSCDFSAFSYETSFSYVVRKWKQTCWNFAHLNSKIYLQKYRAMSLHLRVLSTTTVLSSMRIKRYLLIFWKHLVQDLYNAEA